MPMIQTLAALRMSIAPPGVCAAALTWAELSRTMETLNVYSIIFRLLLSMLIAGVVGLERRYHNRAAGFRTYILVCLGACLVAMTGIFVFDTFKTGDPSRLSAQVISGIGFLGVGTIIVTREKKIHGLTTATGLWVAASVGLAIGSGFYLGGILAGICVWLTMTILHRLENWFLGRRHDMVLQVELRSADDWPGFLKKLRGRGLDVTAIEFNKSSDPDRDQLALRLLIKKKQGLLEPNLVEELTTFPELIFVAPADE